MSLPDSWLAKLNQRREENSFRELNGRQASLADFCSNDYLGFAREPLLQHQDSPAGSSGSRLLTGNSILAEETETFIAGFHQQEAALIFPSGYQANLALFSCMTGRHDTIIYDEFIHASIRDGVRLSGSAAFSFRHNDASDLRKKIRAAKGNVIVAVESLYSMDGDFAPIEDFIGIANELGVNFIVDEAHTGGIYGNQGEGMVPAHPSIIARLFTYGKAFGFHGAAIVGSNLIKDYLVNFSRPFIYSTGLPDQYYLQLNESYQRVQQADGRRKKLWENIHFAGLKSPIHSVIVPGNEQARKMAMQFREKGIDVRAVLSPTVPKGRERLRISIHSFNQPEEIKSMVELLGAVNFAGVRKIFVSGIGTDVGKTVVSAILCEALGADYWKPIQAGDSITDSNVINKLVPGIKIHPEHWLLEAPLSPHDAAEREGKEICLDEINMPTEQGTLIIEGAGGLLVPLNGHELVIDLIRKLEAEVVLVSRNYLGSINHTLLSAEALKQRNIPVTGIIFNGPVYEAGEKFILEYSGLTYLGHIGEEADVNREMVIKYAEQFQHV